MDSSLQSLSYSIFPAEARLTAKSPLTADKTKWPQLITPSNISQSSGLPLKFHKHSH